MTSSPDKNKVFESVIEKEQAHIYGSKENAASAKTYGLAFSGGGIRSASFSLGFMQALVANDKLKKFDYLSTVSGGGYIGSSLTWFLNQKIPAWMHRHEGENAYFSTDAEHFPFGQKCKGDREGANNEKPNAILDFIRQHGNYLIPGHGLNGLSMAGYVLRALLVSLTVYTLLLTCLFIAFIDFGLFGTLFEHPSSPLLNWFGKNVLVGAAAVLGALFFVTGFFYAFWTRLLSGSYQVRTLVQRYLGALLGVMFLFLVVGSFPIAHQWTVFESQAMRFSTSGGSTLLGVVGALFQLKAGGNSKFKIPLLVLAAALLIYGIGLFAYSLGKIIADITPNPYFSLPLLLIAGLTSVMVNVNHLGIHRMYRDRLMETFLPNLSDVKNNNWGLATEANKIPLHKLCQQNPRPYHLINTNVVLVDSNQSKFRGRGGDNFILSPLFCGSDATGWRESDKYKTPGSPGGITLPTAMAISGAALNPNSGVGGVGITRNKLVSTLLAILNLKLGYWISNPDPDKTMSMPPNFLSPGLKGGVLGGGLSEDRKALELSDGGHFENLGIYELIRRKLNVIVVTDGGADPQFSFGDLANAVEKARVDFGATIVFKEGQYSLDELIPGSSESPPLAGKFPTAKNPFAVADVYYSDDTQGVLIYVKTTLIKNVPADLVGYKTANETFPDQSTGDQFFDERQFEAYRELGYCIGKVLLNENQKTGNQWF